MDPTPAPRSDGPPRAAVVVLLYNSAHLVGPCLDGVAGTGHAPLDVIVVDNGSSDDSASLAAGHPSTPTLIAAGRNLGWAGGNNLGVVEAIRRGARYVALLNPDVILTPTWLGDAVAAMEADPRLAMVDFEGLDGLESGEPPPQGAPSARDIPSGIGAALVASVPALRRIGPIDERYFLYFEDVDWAIRAWRAGYRVGRLNRRLGHAVETSSSDRRRLLRSWLSIRNSIRMFAKYRRRELPGWVLTLARHMVSRRSFEALHLKRLRPYGPLRNLALLGAALVWNLVFLPVTLWTAWSEGRYARSPWHPEAR